MMICPPSSPLQAFKAVLQAGGLVLDDLLTDTKSLRAMVLYHVIEVEVSYREGGYMAGLHGGVAGRGHGAVPRHRGGGRLQKIRLQGVQGQGGGATSMRLDC